MANPEFTPYVSEFEYASRFHPSKNPDCPIESSGNPDERYEEINRGHFDFARYRRSPEEGSPVGQEPSIEVRAILVRCPKTEEETDDVLINRNIYNITAGRSQDILDFHGFDRDEPTRHSEVRDCRRKLVITMKFNNIGRTKTQEEFVVIDHVLDPVTMHKARLLNPFVVKVRQEPVLQLYGLKFQGVVNAEAREEVMSNKQSNYTGCDDTSENPTCGQMFFDEKPIPYSQGFCCSCDPDVNVQRQASTLNETVPSSFSNFFSKTKDRAIRPYKNRRSAKTIDDLSNAEEINEYSFSKDIDENAPENSKNLYYQKTYQPVESNSALVENLSNDEKDLINLKSLKTKNENSGKSSISRSDENEDKNGHESYVSPRWVASSLLKNLSGTINEKLVNLIDGGRDSEMNNKDVITESQRKDEENLSKRKSSINIINELTKLEEDYKNFRISSIMRDQERSDGTSDNTRLNAEMTTSENDKYFDHRLNVDDVKHFGPIETPEKKLFPKNYFDDRKLILTSIPKKNVPVDEMIYDRSSTLSIDVKPAFEPRDKSTINRVNSTVTLSNIYSSEILRPVTTMTRTFEEAQTIATLWQKLASDRVYPSSGKTNVYTSINTNIDKDRLYSTEMTTSLHEKFDNTKLPRDSNLQFNHERSSLNDTYNGTMFESSNTIVSKDNVEIARTSESTYTLDQRDENDFTTSFDESPSHSENFTDSSSSFSSRNHTKNDAIVLSGSLRDQLVNWLTYGERKKYETRDGRENSRENYDEKIEFGNHDDVENARVTSLHSPVKKKPDLYDDRSMSIIADRKPVEIHLETIYDRESSNGIDDKTILTKTRSNVEKSLRGASLDYWSPEEVHIIPRKQLKRWNIPRSYRSIGEDDRFFDKDNDRQRNIDKQIEDEFVKISDVLKDAGDTPKITREKPKSDETFEKDDSVMEKFAAIFDKIPKDITQENVSKIHENSFEIQTTMSRKVDGDPEIFQPEKDRIIAIRSKLRKINDASKIGRNSYGNLTLEEENLIFPKFYTTVGDIPVIKPITEEIRLRVTDRETTSKILKNTEEFTQPVSEISQTTEHRIIVDRFKIINEYKDIPENHEQSSGFTNVSAKIRNLMENDSTTRYYEYTTIVKNESSSEINSEISLTTGHRRIVDIFKNFKESRDIPDKNKKLSKHTLSKSRKLTNMPLKREKELLTNISFANVPSPIFTIENLKKQLGNEADHYSSFSQSQSTATSSNFRNIEKNPKYADEVREVNTELTPAEKVEDLITDEETLPPDEETSYTTSSFSKTTTFPTSTITASFVELGVSNTTVFPRFAIRSFDRNFPKEKHMIISKKPDKVFLLLEESSQSSSASLRNLKNERSHKKSIHRRRRHRRNNRNNRKHLTKNKRNIATTNVVRSFAKVKAENEDDENTWYDTTMTKRLTVSYDRIDEATTKILSTTIPSISNSHKKRKRRYYHERPVISENNHHKQRYFSNGDQQPSNGGKWMLSISSISNVGRDSNIQDPSTKDISKPVEKTQKILKHRAEPNSNVELTTHDLPLNSSRKQSIFQGFIGSSKNADAEKISESTKPEVTTERSTRNFQISSSRTFPSFYPKSSDIIAMSEHERLFDNTANRRDRNNKRHDTMDINGKEREDHIFYDYEDSEDKSINDNVNSDDKRSLENVAPEEIIDSIEPSEGWKEKMELLKLKKHADVLKEYLNWRQDVAPPESNGFPGYSTKISMMKESPEETTIFVTTSILNGSEWTTLPSTESTCTTTTEFSSPPIEQSTDAETMTSSGQQTSITEDSTIFSTLESSSIKDVTDDLKNLDTMHKIEIPAGCFDSSNNDSTTKENVHYDEEASTGRILPPCDNKIEFSKNFDHQSSNRSNVYTHSESENITLPRAIPDRHGHMSNMDKDLIIISVLEKNLLGNNNIRGRHENRDALAKIYKIHEEVGSAPNSRHHPHRFKKNNSIGKSDRRKKRVPGRRLMSVQVFDEINDNYEEDFRFEESEENHYVDSSNDVNINDSETLQVKWNGVIDKIIHENSSVSSLIENGTKPLLKDIAGDNRSVLKQLHFYDADKYINKIAKKIVHSSNSYEPKDERDMGLDKIKVSRRKATLVGRKLKEYPDKSMNQRLRFKMADSYQNRDDSSELRLNSVHKNDISNITLNTEQPGREKYGRDFAISLRGNIHVEGGTNGRPISISFDTSPDVPKTNETLQLTSNETAKYANDTRTDAAIPPSKNFLSNLFNIATGPKEFEHSTQKDDKNSNVSLHQSVRAVHDDKLRLPRANHRQKFSDFTNKVPMIRKSRAIEPQPVNRNTKYRDDRSYDLEDSQDSENAADSEDYPKSSIEDEYDSKIEENDDYSAVSRDRSNLESEHHYSNIDGRGRLSSPEVKVIKIIPLNVEKSSASLSSFDSNHENQQDTKISRMTASQLPKMVDEDLPDTIVKPGKIRPAELPWRENENDDQEVLDPTNNICASKPSESYAPNSPKEDKTKEPDDLPPDRRMSTTNPMNLRVIGLVSMGQPTMNERKNLNSNSDLNYEIVPLIHVKIQQQPIDKIGPDRSFIIPLRPDNHRVGCSKIDMTHSKNVLGDNSLCSPIDEARNKVDDVSSTRKPVLSTLNMDNDEELREPIATTCPEFNNSDIRNEPNFLDDNKFERIRPVEESSPYQGNGKTSTTTSTQDSISNSRKKIRMKNMLAILEFMKKINKIMSGGDRTDFPNEDYNDAVIKLERVIILPKNRSDGIFGRHKEPETSTHRAILMGEGIRHDSTCDGLSPEENSILSMNQEINDPIGHTNKASKFNETKSLNKSFKSYEKSAKDDENQSFLFYRKNDKPLGNAASSDHSPSDNRFLANLKNIENITNFGIKGENDSYSSLPNSTSSTTASSKDSSADNEATVVVDPDKNGGSKERVVLQNFDRKIDDRLRDLRNENSADYEEANIGKMKKRMRQAFVNKRIASNDDFPSFSKTKRRRSMKRLPSYRNNYRYRDERDAGGQIYRSKSSSDVVNGVGDEKFGRFAAVNNIDREKRKKKKEKKRRKKKRKRKKKKKKGKDRNEAANRGKGWWPFGRQLMSLSERRHVISDSNFDRRQLERVKTNKRANRRNPFSLKRRKIRRVHRANYPHGKKKKSKKHLQHKQGRKKKKVAKKMKVQEEKPSERNKRQIKPGGTQARGGQDCLDRRHPSNVNPVKYLESSHCLRFSDLWQEIDIYRYSAYEMENPIMEHTVYLQLFEKHSLPDGSTHWDDLTQGTMVRMGTFTRHQRDDKPTIVFTYSGAKIESQNRALNLDPSRQRLLVPSPVPLNKASQYPAVRGPGEYLVVQTSAISKDGKDCDKAGVGFAAFVKQKDRCGRAKGTCLKNQPLAYWRHDMEARASGRRGCYFLSNFGSVPMNPIKYNVSGTGSREYLGLEYHSTHVSAIDIEVRTDYNAIVRVGSSGRVTEVYVDSTSLEHTVVTVVISNMGLASSPYQPRITDCPTGLPVSWTKAKGIMQVIPPQHDQRVTLDLYGQLLLNGFHCSVEVVNHRGELVAMRRIRIQKMDRCFCVWHCLCACIGSVSGMGCQPMSPEHYHAAGFQGPVPVITTETSILMNTIKDVLMLSALLVVLLFLLGLLKWFVGIFAPSVGRWGLESLLDGSKIEKYLESELRCRCVVTDDDGVPVHPDTGERTVRLCSRKLEFVLNLIFFLTYPIAMCCGYFRKSLRSSQQRRCCPDESKMCLINEKSSCPKMICVSTYGDSRNSRLEAEDTRYVMNELKKSQESLQNPKGTKKKDGRKNDKALSRKSSHRNKSALDVTAKRLVDDLLKKRTVFRNLTEPIGGLVVPSGTNYSLRGYFLNAENGGYRFITPCPFKQHWLIENNQKKSSKPPEIYPSNLFMCFFGTARDVYDSNEISLSPKGICINVQYLDDK